MPNSHSNSKLMRVQNETAQKIEMVALTERRAANAQLAVIVDEWLEWKGYDIDTAGVRPARHDTPRITR